MFPCDDPLLNPLRPIHGRKGKNSINWKADNTAIRLAELSVLFLRTVEKLLLFQRYSKGQIKHDISDLQMPICLFLTACFHNVSIKTFAIWIYFLAWFEFSGCLLPGDTEGDESITLSSFTPSIKLATGLTSDRTYLGGDEVPIVYLQDRVFERAMLKQRCGRPAKHFCGHSLTSKEGFSVWIMQDISHQDMIHLLRLFRSLVSHS